MQNVASSTTLGTTTASRRGIVPYRQGDLDGLCGLYAVVNAMRIATRNRIDRDQDFWAEVFSMLLVKTETHIGLVHAMNHGIHRRALLAILRDAARELAADFDLYVRIHRPFKNCGPLSREVVVSRIAWHIQELGCATIAVINRPAPHWTVLLEIDQTELHILDSVDRAGIPNVAARSPRDFDPKSVIVLEHRV